MRARDLTRYCSDLGWTDAPDLPDSIATHAAAPPSQGDDLDRLAASLEGCTRCRLCEQRRTIVFGEGDSHAAVMFIGEGPGADEDRTGRPFVGQAGKLLDVALLQFRDLFRIDIELRRRRLQRCRLQRFGDTRRRAVSGRISISTARTGGCIS